jgi:hypothetical protein
MANWPYNTHPVLGRRHLVFKRLDHIFHRRPCPVGLSSSFTCIICITRTNSCLWVELECGTREDQLSQELGHGDVTILTVTGHRRF